MHLVMAFPSMATALLLAHGLMMGSVIVVPIAERLISIRSPIRVLPVVRWLQRLVGDTLAAIISIRLHLAAKMRLVNRSRWMAISWRWEPARMMAPETL